MLVMNRKVYDNLSPQQRAAIDKTTGLPLSLKGAMLYEKARASGIATVKKRPDTSITTLTALDFLGFGLPPGSASLGEMLQQGKANLQAPWLGITAFVVLSVMLTLLIFIFEGVRDAFDPRKLFAGEPPPAEQAVEQAPLAAASKQS